jgi:hypothetical protein
MAKKRTVVTFKKAVAVQRPKAKKVSAPRTRIGSEGKLTRDLACAVLDPFSCSACIPDGRTNSGCFSLKADGQLSTGASTGTCCSIAICPQNGFINKVDSGSTSTTPTFTGVWSSSNLATLQAQYQACRPVSCGLRLTFAGATQTDQGTIIVGQAPTDFPLSQLSAATMQTLSQELSDYRVIPLRNGAEITWRPECMDDMMTWSSIASGIANQNVTSGPTVPYIVAVIYGAEVNSVAVNYEWVMSFEGQFNNLQYVPGGISSQKATGPMAEPGWYERMKNIVDKVAPIFPLVGSTLTAVTGVPAFAALGSLANGIRYPAVIGKSSRSRF